MIPFKIKTINHANDFFFSQLVASADGPGNQWILRMYVKLHQWRHAGALISPLQSLDNQKEVKAAERRERGEQKGERTREASEWGGWSRDETLQEETQQLNQDFQKHSQQTCQRPAELQRLPRPSAATQVR